MLKLIVICLTLIIIVAAVCVTTLIGQVIEYDGFMEECVRESRIEYDEAREK